MQLDRTLAGRITLFLVALFVRITPRSGRERADGALYAFDMSEQDLVERVIGPYDRGEVITLGGRSLPTSDISSIEITEITDVVLGRTVSQLRSLWTTGSRRQTGDWIARHAPSVTDRYVSAHLAGCAQRRRPSRSSPGQHGTRAC